MFKNVTSVTSRRSHLKNATTEKIDAMHPKNRLYMTDMAFL